MFACAAPAAAKLAANKRPPLLRGASWRKRGFEEKAHLAGAQVDSVKSTRRRRRPDCHRARGQYRGAVEEIIIPNIIIILGINVIIIITIIIFSISGAQLNDEKQQSDLSASK